MSLIARRLRSLLIALAVLALSATAVLAGRSALTAPAALVASQQDVDDDAGGDEEGSEEEELDGPKDEETDPAEDADGEEGAPDGETETPSGEHPDNHGKLVAEAAHAATPAEFDNHGGWVRSVAKDNHGHSDAVTSQRAGKKDR